MRGERLCPSFAFMGYEGGGFARVLLLWVMRRGWICFGVIVDLLLKVRTESVYQS